MTSNDPLSLDELSTAIRSQLILSSLPTTTTATPPPPTTTTTTTTTTASTTTITTTSTTKTKKQPTPSPPSTTTPYDRWSLRPPTSINYGFLSSNPHPQSPTGYYITTAINYTNGPAHMGHAYEAVTADCIARFHRLIAKEEGCWFVTGSDEHGQKIKATAEGEGKKPIEICDKYVTGFQCLNQRLLISNDDYIRTTSTRHKSTARHLWSLLTPHIYLSTYTGWYNVREETFVTDSDAALWDYKDPTSGNPLKKVSERSYFFKMGEYHDWLVEHIEKNDEFIQPKFQRNAILARLKADRLRDLSISRTTFDWGVEVPNDEEHVMYVWVDALSNYLTGVDALGLGADISLKSYWPANVHIIGKDILWFHTVIWPTLLCAANLPLPTTIFAHGFVNDKFGKKMSKSVGNVVDPHDMLDKYSVDAFRWYLCKEAPYGGELSFSEDSLRDMQNSDLADTLGNLIHRGTNLCQKYCKGEMVAVTQEEKPPVDFELVRKTYVDKMTNFELNEGATIVMQAFRDVNGYLTDREPWKMKGENVEERQRTVVMATLEAVYALAHLLLPFLPDGGRLIFDKLGMGPKGSLWDLKGDLRNLELGCKVKVGGILYAKIQSEEEIANAALAAQKKKDDYAAAQKRKKEAKAKQASQSKQQQNNTSENKNQPSITKIDIRIGKITKVWHHPDADKLFCEDIDVGEDQPRQITSGLREHYTLQDMQDRYVLVVCNLKPSKIVGFASHGMVLAAKGDGKVELVDPPEGGEVGERVTVEGVDDDGSFEPLSAAQVKKKKVLEEVTKGLKTGEGGVAQWEGNSLSIKGRGVCKVASLVGAPIS